MTRAGACQTRMADRRLGIRRGIRWSELGILVRVGGGGWETRGGFSFRPSPVTTRGGYGWAAAYG